MAYSGNTFLFDNIIANENDGLSGMDLLGERLQEMSESDNPDWQLKYQKTKEGGKEGYNIQLPGGADFRIENGKITFSKFGMSKDELKEVYSYLNTLSISGLSFDPEEPEDFKQTAIEARDELRSENGAYENGSFLGASMAQENGGNESERIPEAANSNIQPATEEMTDEERIAAIRRTAKTLEDKAVARFPRKKPEKPHPNADDILGYMNTHVRLMQKEKSKNYKISSCGNGWDMTWYKDADQKKEGPTADKKGKVNPNFEFALRGEIVSKNGKPHLQLTMMTPKYGDMADWMMEEAIDAAKSCKCTHIRFNASYQHKSKFFTACGKKLMIPTGVKLKEKDVNTMLKAAKENNDDPEKRATFYRFLAEQLEEQMIAEGITNEAHPFVKMVKELRDSAKNEGEATKAQVKYKKFNQFFENNIMGKIYPDGSDTPVPSVNTVGIETDAVKQLATGRAYVEFLAMYRDDNTFANASDEAKRAKYLELYNKNIYKYDKKLEETLDGLDDKRPADRKQKKDLIKDEYDVINSDIRALTTSLKHDYGVDIESPDLIRRSYEKDQNKQRAAKGRQSSGGALNIPARGRESH